jgi:hypothetical protein
LPESAELAAMLSIAGLRWKYLKNITIW